MIYLLVEPRFRSPQAVDVTILDEGHQPVSGATLSFHESEFVALIPWLVFASPYTTIEKDRSVVTDQWGKAHFGIQFDTHARAITYQGMKLQIVSQDKTEHAVSRLSGEKTIQFGNREGTHMPSWYTFRGGDATCNWTSTIIVNREQNQP